MRKGSAMSEQSVPFLDLVTPHRELEEELVGAFREALRSAAFIGGPQVEGFEREFAEYCGTKYSVGVANGTDAMRFALMASGVGAGDAVITVSHTFIATVEAISQAGAATEFVDIDEATYTMSPGGLGEYLARCRKDPATGRPLGQRTGQPIKAIVPVHLYGQVADMDALDALAREYELLVIEDACQAQGSEYQSSADGVWRRAGSFGKAAGFSFYPGKNLGACGEAGAVTTDDPDVARTVRMLREHGQARKYYHDLEGYNGRLDAIQASFLRIKLRHLDRWNGQRREAAARYAHLLASVPDVTVPAISNRGKSNYHLYVVRTSDREALASRLNEQGIHTGLHYPLPVHLQNCYRDWGYAKGSLPTTERVAGEVLSLPMYPGLSVEQQARVVQQVAAFAGTRSQSPVVDAAVS
jgi:dTDP-4-amino-4,6-dideoxygalactose transaminase